MKNKKKWVDRLPKFLIQEWVGQGRKVNQVAVIFWFGMFPIALIAIIIGIISIIYSCD